MILKGTDSLYKMAIPNPKNGIVAILDALGAANYDDSEIGEFLESRHVVMKLLSGKSESVAQNLNVAQIKTYTFNDTMLIVLEVQGNRPSSSEIQAFTTVLRKLLVDSLRRKIMFRGSFAIGTFYEDSNTNTILGKAVTDAASWYNRADWIGIIATPLTTIHIDYQMEKSSKEWRHLLIRYEVPLSGNGQQSLWAINWPKVFWAQGITPCKKGEKPRETFLNLLTRFDMPIGVESKHFNAIKFFDYVMEALHLKNVPSKGLEIKRPQIKSR